MTSTKYFALSVLTLFALVLVVSFVSADVDFIDTSIPSSANPGSDVTLTFKIKNLNTTTTLTDVQFEKVTFFGASSTFDSGSTFSNVPSSLTANATSGTISVSVHIPSAQAAGSYTGVIRGTGKYSGTTFDLAPENVNIAVAQGQSLTITQLTAITQTSNGTIRVTNNGNVALNNILLSSEGSFTVKFYSNGAEITSISSLAAGQPLDLTVSPINLGTLSPGGKSTTIKASSGTAQANLGLTVSGSFCRFGEVGNLEITGIDISNNGEGEDEEWQLLDEIEVEIDVENTGNDDIDDIVVEIGLFDSTGTNQIGDLEFSNTDEEEFEIGDLDDGDEETATFTFRVPADFDEDNYRFTVKAYSDKAGEDEQCTSQSNDLDTDDAYTQIDVQLESDEGKFITYDNIDFAPLEGTCGETVTMSFNVFNIGDEDIEDRVKVNVKNSELGVNQFVEILSDLDQGDEESVTLSFMVPQSATDKFYNLALSSEYDYKNGVYRSESDEDTIVPFRVIGCGTNGGNNGGTGENIALINAVLQSDEAVAGEEVVVTATIANLKTTSTTFTVSATGYSSWAELENSGAEFLQLDAGESGEITFTFLTDEDASGRQSFDIEVRDGTGNVQKRTVDVNVEGTGTGSDGFDFGDNTFLWIIGIVNVILVVLIIVVIVRIARR